MHRCTMGRPILLWDADEYPQPPSIQEYRIKKMYRIRRPGVSPGDGYRSAVGAFLSKNDLSLYPSIRLICSSLEKLHLDMHTDIDIQAGRSARGRSL